jgi:hypothetical protein
MLDSLVPGTVDYYPKPRIFGNCFVGVGSVGAPLRVFRFTLQGLLIHRLSASHRYPRLLNQVAMISLDDGVTSLMFISLMTSPSFSNQD